ncbi:MAG: DUF1636 family protein [Thermosynechococcaceae cyanobacterium]
MTQHALFVCRSCAFSHTQRDYVGQRGGYHLLNSLQRLQEQWPLPPGFKIEAVDCLSACDRPCTIALAATGKSTLMFGDLQPFHSAAPILQLAHQYYSSSDGIIPRNSRPDALKKGILARIPFPNL